MNIFNKFLNLVFPIKCLNCQVEGPSYVCGDCLKKIELNNRQTCPTCRKYNIFGNFCSQTCKNGFYFDALMVCGDYGDPLISNLLKAYKYKFCEEISYILGLFLLHRFFLFNQDEIDLITFVPLHKNRLKYRGFNQSELLAEIIAKECFIQFLYCLKRTSHTTSQASLDKKHRLTNLIGAFELNERKEILNGRSILLIDDVATTCTTLNECSKVLKKEGGAKKVYALVLARGK